MPEISQFALLSNSAVPPQHCQYASGPCDQDFATAIQSDALLLYPNLPEFISETIEDTVKQLSNIAGDRKWLTWKSVGVQGQIIFCEVCKGLRHTKLAIADVTTLNFNLLFEIGYALGLGIPVLPIRDTSHVADSKEFEELGILDTFGYFDYRNSIELRNKILAMQQAVPLALQTPALNTEQPLYVVKGPFDNDGMIKLMSVVKKSRLKFRSFDAKEIARISLHEIFKQTLSSRAVLLHLIAPELRGARVHNARCAFIAGLAMSTQKRLLMLQQSIIKQPIDYRIYASNLCVRRDRYFEETVCRKVPGPSDA